MANGPQVTAPLLDSTRGGPDVSIIRGASSAVPAFYASDAFAPPYHAARAD
jgi:hypothetical protein